MVISMNSQWIKSLRIPSPVKLSDSSIRTALVERKIIIGGSDRSLKLRELSRSKDIKTQSTIFHCVGTMEIHNTSKPSDKDTITQSIAYLTMLFLKDENVETFGFKLNKISEIYSYYELYCDFTLVIPQEDIRTGFKAKLWGV